MTKPEKFTKQEDFSRAVERAAADYDRLRADAEWTKDDLAEIAKSSAIDEGLSYDGFQVDPAVAKAICDMADAKLPKSDGMKALDDAWKQYSKYSK